MPVEQQLDMFAGGREPPPRAGARPLLRYAGGKRWVVDLCAEGIHRRLYATQGRYFEPFLGGGALALELGHPRMVLGDANPDVVCLYSEVRDSAETVHEELRRLIERGTDEEAYYAVRREVPVEGCARAARAAYLSAAGYNGVWRVNRRGEYNVPWGQNLQPSFPSRAAFMAAQRALATSEIRCEDFSTGIARAGRGDCLFIDSPYHETFTAYTPLGFTDRDQEDLAHCLHAAADRGATIVATNSDTPEVREWYSWAQVIPTAELRAVNRDAAGRKRRGCLVIVTDQKVLG